MPIPRGYSEVLHSSNDRFSVEAAWTFFADKSYEHRVLPDGRCDIILHFHSDGSKPLDPISVIIAGAATRSHIVTMEAGTGYVGVRLRPGSARSILGITLKEIANQGLGGDTALAQIPALAGLCASSQSIKELSDRLTSFVAERFRNLQIDPLTIALIDTLHTTGGRLAISEIALLHGMDVRAVHRRIVRGTGLSPKQMAMVIQFHRALRLLVNERLDIPSAAFEAGYADQAHMTRTFRHMGGFSPARLPELVLAGFPI